VQKAETRRGRKKPESWRARQSKVFSPYLRDAVELPIIPGDAGTKVESIMGKVRLSNLQQRLILNNA